jgi:hypothetical protein
MLPTTATRHPTLTLAVNEFHRSVVSHGALNRKQESSDLVIGFKL